MTGLDVICFAIKYSHAITVLQVVDKTVVTGSSDCTACAFLLSSYQPPMKFTAHKKTVICMKAVDGMSASYCLILYGTNLMKPFSLSRRPAFSGCLVGLLVTAKLLFKNCILQVVAVACPTCTRCIHRLIDARFSVRTTLRISFGPQFRLSYDKQMTS